MAVLRRIGHFSGATPVARRLGVVVVIFFAIVGSLIVLSTAEMAVLSAVRSYVRGEGLWSKAQKHAVIRLRRYAESRDPADWAAFRQALAVPLGDREARLALDGPTSDIALAARGFRAGRNHPDDIPGMIALFRRFRDVRYMAEAIDIWADADRQIERLARVGAGLDLELRAGRPHDDRIARLVRKIDDVETKVTPLEDAFSATLGEGARWLHRLVVRVTWGAGALLATLGVWLSWTLLGHARAWEERYRRLVETATDAIVVSDAETDAVVEVNAKALELLGAPASSVLGTAAAALYPSGDAAAYRHLVRAAIDASNAATGELHLRRADGALVPVEASAGLTVVAGRRYVQVILRDIRERRRTEAALAASRRRMESEARVAHAHSRVGHVLMGSLDTPAVLRRLAELGTRELRADASAIFLHDAETGRFTRAAAHPEPTDGAGVLDDAVIEALRATDCDAATIPAGRGGVARLGLVLRRGEALAGIQIATRDADGARFSDEDLRIARGIAHLGSMALANGMLVAELERASRLKSEFVSTMSHELRTPLNVILGYAEMARDATGETDRVGFIARMEDAGRELLELIESTLEVGKADAGRDDARVERVHLGELWAAMGRGCARMPRRPEVVLDWQETAPDVAADTDPRKLVVIVRNLVSNALKFTERGFVRVTIGIDGDALVAAVADTGIGIRPEDQTIVFEMFRQADGSDSRRFGGTGLGLYIARRFATQLGGSVDLESAPGAGTTVTVRLPGAVAATRRSDVA